jgi:hypothetical protein
MNSTTQKDLTQHLNRTETTRRMWELAQANAERLHYAGTGRLWYRPDGAAWDAPGLFIELRIERHSYRQPQDPRFVLVAHAMRRDAHGQISHVEAESGDYEATYMARSDYSPAITEEQLESAVGRMQSWGDYVAQ